MAFYMVSWTVLEPQVKLLGGELKAYDRFADRLKAKLSGLGKALEYVDQRTQDTQVVDSYRYRDPDGVLTMVAFARRFWAEDGPHRWYCFDVQVVRTPKFVGRAIDDATHLPTKALVMDLGELVASWPEVDSVDVSAQ